MRRLRLRCNGVRKSSASRIYDGALTIMGRWGRILVTLRLDTCTRLGCGFEERAVEHRSTEFRSWCLFVCCVVPGWFVLVLSNLDILQAEFGQLPAGCLESA